MRKIYRLYAPSGFYEDYSEEEFGYYSTKNRLQKAINKYKNDFSYGKDLMVEEIILDKCDRKVEKIVTVASKGEDLMQDTFLSRMAGMIAEDMKRTFSESLEPMYFFKDNKVIVNFKKYEETPSEKSEG